MRITVQEVVHDDWRYLSPVSSSIAQHSLGEHLGAPLNRGQEERDGSRHGRLLLLTPLGSKLALQDRTSSVDKALGLPHEAEGASRCGDVVQSPRDGR